MTRSPTVALSTIRKVGLALAVFTLVTAVVATQWPFAYALSRDALSKKWAEVDWSWVHRTPSGAIRFDRDFAQNLVMLFPLGLGFGLWRRARRVRVVVESLVLGIATGVVLETAQLATPHRFTQLPDAWRNAVGCLAGGIAAIVIDRVLSARRFARVDARV